jgi:ketosteroid isomerase-like protein
MSETNKQLVKQGYERFGTGDIQGLLELFADDIQWTVPAIENAAFAGSRSGKASVAQFFTQLTEGEEITEFAPTEFIAEGDKVVVIGKSAATVRSTGRSYSTQWVHIFTVRDGKIAEFLEVFDNAAATRAFQKAASA